MTISWAPRPKSRNAQYSFVLKYVNLETQNCKGPNFIPSTILLYFYYSWFISILQSWWFQFWWYILASFTQIEVYPELFVLFSNYSSEMQNVIILAIQLRRLLVIIIDVQGSLFCNWSRGVPPNLDRCSRTPGAI